MLELTVGRQGVIWDSASQKFIADASTTQWESGAIKITNPKTNQARIFTPRLAQRSVDGDIQFWVLKSPEGHTLTMFNT